MRTCWNSVVFTRSFIKCSSVNDCTHLVGGIPSVGAASPALLAVWPGERCYSSALSPRDQARLARTGTGGGGRQPDGGWKRQNPGGDLAGRTAPEARYPPGSCLTRLRW